MDFLCPNCQKMLTVPDQYAGTKMKCPLCAAPFSAPALPSQASAPAAGPFSSPPPPSAPPSVPMPPSMTSGPSAGTPPPPPPPPGDYRGVCSMPLDPRVVMWIAPAALIMAFLLQPFFSFTGMFPAGYPVYSQGAWGAAFGQKHAEANPLWDKMAEQNPSIPAVVVRPESLSLQFFMILYVLLFFPLALVLCVIAAVMPLVTMPLPPIVNQIKPWRWAIAGGVALVPLLLLVAQMIFGFGLEQKVEELVDRKMPGAPAATTGTGTGATGSTQPGTASPATAPATLTDEDKIKLSMARASLLGAQVLQRTTWLKLTVFLHVLAVVAAGLQFWLERRQGQGRPVPRLEARW